ncbi:DDE_Tnp_IS1595 domain-containing protein [Trichonephila clavipes]|nr:DDE_Tnp_IS1595 domain-containing protein [Trichonephila clavipes]
MAKERRVKRNCVFGGMQRDSKKCFFHVVPNRTKVELLSVVRERILPGTMIILDCWRAYKCLSNEGYRYLTVSHSLTFKDPETGSHTNAIEGTWSAIKRSLKGHMAHVEGQFDSYLAEYMRRQSNEHEMIDTNFQDYLKEIAHVYPPKESDDQK